MVLNELKDWMQKMRTSTVRTDIIENRNEIKACPICNSNIEDRVITIFAGMIDVLYDIYKWCGKNQRHEFKMSDVRQFMDHNVYTRFGDFVRCSCGIIYRPSDVDKKKTKGEYGMNMARAKEFFRGQRSMPMQIRMNQITGEKEVLQESLVGGFPSLSNLINKEGLYDHEMLL